MNADTATPRVAVLIPCYKDGALVAEAVDSVQEDEPFELVVIDDCSPDDYTQQVMRELAERGVTVIRHETNRGVAAARNTGLRNTTAPYIFALDSDDLATPGILARMADQLDAHPEADLAYGDYQEFGESDALREVPADPGSVPAALHERVPADGDVPAHAAGLDRRLGRAPRRRATCTRTGRCG